MKIRFTNNEWMTEAVLTRGFWLRRRVAEVCEKRDPTTGIYAWHFVLSGLFVGSRLDRRLDEARQRHKRHRARQLVREKKRANRKSERQQTREFHVLSQQNWVRPCQLPEARLINNR